MAQLFKSAPQSTRGEAGIQRLPNWLAASIARPNPGAAYNLCDDDPAPPQDVLLYAAELMGVDPPPEVPFDQAELGPMARSFYAESKRVRNDLIKQELGIALRHPDYRSGLRAVMAAEAAEGVVQDHGQSG